MARFCVTYNAGERRTHIVLTFVETNLSFVLLHIDLISQNDKGEVLRVMRACLNEELITPAVEGFK